MQTALRSHRPIEWISGVYKEALQLGNRVSSFSLRWEASALANCFSMQLYSLPDYVHLRRAYRMDALTAI